MIPFSFAGQQYAYRVTIADNPGFTGYQQPSHGAISDPLMKGLTIDRMGQQKFNPYDFWITIFAINIGLGGDNSKFIREVLVENGAGVLQRYTTFDITTNGVDFTHFSMGNGSAIAWVAADASEVRTVLIRTY